jgi:hypothetical protein
LLRRRYIPPAPTSPDTDGHCFRDIEVETDKGAEEACSLAMERASEIERTGDVCCWEAFESSGQAEYVDSVSTGDTALDVPIEYRCGTERSLLQEFAELKAELKRLRDGAGGERAGARAEPREKNTVVAEKIEMVCSQCGSEKVLADAYGMSRRSNGRSSKKRSRRARTVLSAMVKLASKNNPYRDKRTFGPHTELCEAGGLSYPAWQWQWTD